MKTILYIFIGSLYLMSTTANAKLHFIIEMIKVPVHLQAADIVSYQNALAPIAKEHNGVLHVNPIAITKQLETTVRPEITSVLTYDYLLITTFDSKKNALKYYTQTTMDTTLQKYLTSFTNHTVILGSVMNALPGVPEFPVITNALINQKSSESFILINTITMRKSIGALFKMMNYFKRNYPLLKAHETQFYATYKLKKVLKGNFNHKMLFLTQWKDLNTFYDVHNDTTFKKNVHLRNTSFKSFTEAKGILIP